MSRTSHIAIALAFLLGLAGPAAAELKPGDAAPDFTAPAYLAGEPFDFDLAKARADGPVVVYFFPAANTPGCNIEAHLFSEAIDAFKTHDTTVIGVTAGNLDQLAEFSSNTETCSGRFAVAADTDASIARSYDALLALKPEWSSRTSYLVSGDGRILAVHSDMSPDGHVKAMLDAAATAP
ncbi:peroxiredoxin [Lysobacter sp. SG-8]|uniref:thioredoxin-dependent peroxiredoxin n=1 Tax=Marilutibacter penaei TaxID=2759900 RepID=A0A7W3YDZ3_9GAMM|nr:peroxiredoxin [Lysobacter penaei]MBB1087587.1 peroxiredoxin [Lysobacter penaei]